MSEEKAKSAKEEVVKADKIRFITKETSYRQGGKFIVYPKNTRVENLPDEVVKSMESRGLIGELI